MLPKVSIIMSVYNGERFLASAIESVLSQTFSNFEFIIVDDFSSDGTALILKNFAEKDGRLRIIKNTGNLGLTKSLNIALKESKGEYIARLDDSDLMMPERLEKQVSFLDENKDVGLVGTWAYIIDDQGGVIGEIKHLTEDKIIKKDLIRHNLFIHPSIMFRRSTALSAGLYDEDYKYGQDYNFYFRIFPYTKFANLPAFLLKYRKSKESLTFIKNRKQIFFANKARKFAIEKKYYSKLAFVYVFLVYLTSLLPTRLKFFLRKIFS